MGGEQEKPRGYVIPQRSTRGRRVAELSEELLEADEEFWGQKAWQEASDDDDLQSDEWSDEEKQDQEDSDFDDVDEVKEEQERAQQALELEKQEKRRQRSEKNKRKNGVYVDPALRGSNKRQRTTGEPKRRENLASVIPVSRRQMRRSTKATTASTNAALDQASKTRGKIAHPAQAKEPLVRLTQRQLLEEAARTEVENKRSLEIMMMLQQENKRERHKAETHQTPRVIYFSSSKGVRRDAEGKALDPIRKSITFTHVSSVPAAINAKPPTPPEKPICTVTGLPAKYRDPETGIPYRTVEAFKVLRRSNAT
mmetsp:Transcript_14850/g.27469  ORF Transcript_14850/g.27469 Transcript_14850/m.27469 type:complete len:311 (+) Transcript_14850:171-1103(+)